MAMGDRQMSAQIIGGPKMVSADLDAFTAVADSLEEIAAELDIVAYAFRTEGTNIGCQASVMPGCPAALGVHAPGHETVLYPALAAELQRQSEQYTVLVNRFQDCSQRLVEVYSGYSWADRAAERLITEGIQLVFSKYPAQTSIAGLILGVGTITAGSIKEGSPNLLYGLTETGWAQEGLLSGFGTVISGKGLPTLGRKFAIGGIFSTDEVNEAATSVSRLGAPAYDLFQGNALTVERVEPNMPFLDAPRTIEEAMRNLYLLGQERLYGKDGTGLSYGTVAIQKFENADGSVSWLVTIPGTDGKPDSPFGWPQNADLMSDEQERRMNADSARMVMEAMEQAGIGADEPVTLIGHSQGGIVSAVLASDFKDRYNFQHVVTCGSPIANHSIPKDTWVTSIENQDEFVSKLDGAANPARDTWLTVRGDSSPGAADPDRPFDAVTVEGTKERRELTHGMNYLIAAFQSASAKGNFSLNAHERHFGNLVSGKLKETMYFRGRMSHSGQEEAYTATGLPRQMSDSLSEQSRERVQSQMMDTAGNAVKDAIKDRLKGGLRMKGK